jgi:hypothetical protein
VSLTDEAREVKEFQASNFRTLFHWGGGIWDAGELGVARALVSPGNGLNAFSYLQQSSGDFSVDKNANSSTLFILPFEMGLSANGPTVLASIQKKGNIEKGKETEGEGQPAIQ